MTNKLYQLGREACLKCQIQLSLIEMWVKQITKAVQSYYIKAIQSNTINFEGHRVISLLRLLLSVLPSLNKANNSCTCRYLLSTSSA